MGHFCCSVYGCKNSTRINTLSFFGLPKDSERLKKWLEIIGRQDLLNKEKPSSYRVCSIHFETTMFKNKRLISNAIPSLHLPTNLELSNIPGSNNVIKEKETQVDFTTVIKTFHINKNIITSETASKATETHFSHQYITENLPIDTSPKYAKSEFISSVVTQTSVNPDFRFAGKPNKKISSASKRVMKPVSVQTIKDLSFITPIKNKTNAELRGYNLKTTRKLEHTNRNFSVLSETSTIKRKSDTEFSYKESKSKRRKSVDSKDQNRLCLQDNKNNFIEKLIKWQKELQLKYKGTNFKLFCLNLYFSSPHTYRFFEKCFAMPSVRTLQNMKINFSSRVDEDLVKILSQRLKGMPPNSKFCILCMDEMVLCKNLYYNIKTDEVIGLHEIDGKKRKEIAGNAFVIMLRGCIENYKHPLGYAFTATNKDCSELSDWVDQTIDKLFNSGFEVCAVVSGQGSNFVNFAKIKGVKVEKPFFNVNGKRVFYIFDVPHLVKCIRNNLLTCDFVFDGYESASWSYVEQFYNRDKERNIRLARKVTDAHINPNRFQRTKVRYAAQIFSHSVAAGMSTDIELGHLPSCADGTVNFILKMNNLFDVMNSSKIKDPYKYKNAFTGAEYQTNCLKSALNMFKNIKTKKTVSEKDITTKLHAFTGFLISITSILQLFEYFSSMGHKFIFTRRFNKDPVEKIFWTIRQQGGHSREPTPIQFKRAFSKLVIGSLLENTNLSNSEGDLDKLLFRKDDLNSSIFFANQKPVIQSYSPVVVGTTDYRFDLPIRNTFNYLCGYLLKKCLQKHDCPDFKLYIKQNKTVKVRDHQQYVQFKAFNNSKMFGSFVVPPDDFVAYIELFENRFLSKFESTIVNFGVGKTLMNIMENIGHQHPCPCYPSNYLITLFVRIRIYYAMKFINRKLKHTSVKVTSFFNNRHL